MMEKAIEKIKRELAAAKGLGRAAQVMKKPVAEALMDFCRQDTEFAQAVVQGGSFEDCMKAVEKNCGSSLSDPEAYTRAVRFYFPRAKVNWYMTIDLIGDAAEPDAMIQPAGIVLNLADFL